MHRHLTGLAASRVGDAVRLTGVNVSARDRLRLAELGLRVGAVVTVVSRTAGGGRVVGLGTSRIALDRTTSCRLAVEAP